LAGVPKAFQHGTVVPGNDIRAVEYVQAQAQARVKNSSKVIQAQAGAQAGDKKQAAADSFTLATAYVQLGAAYLTGIGVPAKDEKRAVELFERAADLNDTNAMVNLGLVYFRGSGAIVRDIKTAIEWFKKAGDAGDPEVMYQLGRLHADEYDDLEESVVWLLRAAHSGHWLAMQVLQLDDPADSTERFEWYFGRHEKGPHNPVAMLQVATAFAIGGAGVDPDAKTAAVLFQQAHAALLKQAAACGKNPEILFLLGLVHLHGIGVAANGKVAATWLEKAAALGHPRAMYLLSSRCCVDPMTSDKWLQRAAVSGDPEAMYQLGAALLLQQGAGSKAAAGVVGSSKPDAKTWLGKAAEAGHPAAMFQLGLDFGDTAWLRMAADRGHREAMFRLGRGAENGAAVPESDADWWLHTAALAGHKEARELRNMLEGDDSAADSGDDSDESDAWPVRAAIAFFKVSSAASDAIRWLTHTEASDAAQPDPDAMFRLGIMSAAGIGVVQDDSTALYWFNQAAAEGHVESMYWISSRRHC
jgi:TPR repeat protein